MPHPITFNNNHSTNPSSRKETNYHLKESFIFFNNRKRKNSIANNASPNKI